MSHAAHLAPAAPRRRAAPVATVVAMCASAACLAPLWSLFEGLTWTSAVAWVLVAVGVTGIAARFAGAPRALVSVAQIAAHLLTLTVMFGKESAWLGLLPNAATLETAALLLIDARTAIASSPPPAPSTVGVVFLIAAAAGVVATLTDALAVTWNHPAAAGIPLVLPLLIPAANSGVGLPWWQFVLPAALWLTLIAAAEHRTGRADHTIPSAPGANRSAMVRGGAGALIGMLALAGTVILTGLIPMAPSAELGERFGLTGGSGRIGFTASPDMIADLADSDPVEVLRYTSDDSQPPPLRVSVASRYGFGEWRPDPHEVPVSSSPTLPSPAGLDASVPRREHSVQVTENALAAPHLAAPERVKSGVVTGAQWSMDPDTETIKVERRPSDYELRYTSLTAASAQAATPGADAFPSDDPALDASALSEAARGTARAVTAGANTPYGRAVALQNWFRSGGDFVYSLELAPLPPGMSEEEAQLTAVDRFLESRRGYCVQFSTSMTLMARELGIPARLASGFLPGTSSGGERIVRSSDAHAWPELYFANLGWVRFEPTPGVHTGPAPEHAQAEASGIDPPASPDPTQAAPPTPTATPSAPAAAPPTAAESPSTGSDAGSVLPTLGLLVLVAVLTLALAAPAWVAARTRARRAAGADTDAVRVEAVWGELTERLADLGHRASPTRVLPDAASDLARGIPLDAAAAARLMRLTAVVETARYAPATRAGGAPTIAPPAAKQARADAAAVLTAARAATPWHRRVCARAFPASGRRRVEESVRTRAGARSRRPRRVGRGRPGSGR